MPTAVLVGRVSTEDQGRKGFSLPEQLVECRKKAKDLGATEILEFTDEISGEILDRPGLTAARELIRQGGIKWFVCLTADRLSRKLAHQLLLVEEMRRRQVQLVFAQHGYEDTAEGRFLLSVFGAVAELEKEKIRERTSRGRRGKYKTGKMAQYIDIYGYDLDTVADVLVVNDTEAAWVRRMYDWYTREGLGPYDIRNRLNDLRIPAPRGDFWHKSTVHRIITSATYTGTLVLNRKDWTGVSLNKHRPVEERVAPTWKDESEWVTITVPRVVDQGVFEEAQRRAALAKHVKPRTARMLSGLMTCKLCGGRLHYKSRYGKNDPRTYWYVFCENRFPSYARDRKRATPPCTLKMIPAARIETRVWEEITSWFFTPKSLEQARKLRDAKADNPEPLEQELALVDEQLQTVESEHAELVMLVTKKLARLDKVEPQLQEMMATIGRLESRRAEIRTKLVHKAAAPDPSRDPHTNALTAALRDRWHLLTQEQRDAVTRRHVRSITVNGPSPEDWDIAPH